MVETSAAAKSEATLSLLRLLTQKPQLLLMHADAYSDLIGQEITQASTIWRNRLLFAALAILLLGISGVLCGVAVMFWITTPVVQFQSPWIFWLIPLVPLALALLCLQKVNGYMKRSVFFDLRTQITADQ